MHSKKKNVRIFRLSRRSDKRHPKFNRLLYKFPKSYSVKNRPVVFVGCFNQVQVQNFIQKTFSGYTQVAYEKKEEQSGNT